MKKNKVLTAVLTIGFNISIKSALIPKDGFRCFQIVPGSIYDRLGLKNNDVVCGINGEKIDNPGKAFELFNTLQTQKHFELCVRRGGRETTMVYDIQ